ncbi:DUF3299 domain-containing protein [Asticcacaulis excentricus]|uniref:DUF3299 domain-containing protein n=1 Tax=Asticcacaulis excentricus TaxID=78587 RepID=A0A3G9G2M3_9CAUL|nr:DUF3299 domain-containing protein [Asticcacaulis excentricus]BBF79991.1 hypothetical protein EM6_0569 [Asticcacaulis excentricus]
MRRRDLMRLLPVALSLGAWREQKASTTDGELSGERAFQRTLPRSSDPLWVKLRQCKVRYNAKTALYSLTPTDEVKALIGQTIKVRGFIIPLDGLDMTKHFLIGINTPVCLFHPPGEPNEVIEVRSLKAVPWNDKPVTIEGQFKLISNPEMGVFFAMTNAKPVKA